MTSAIKHLSNEIYGAQQSEVVLTGIAALVEKYQQAIGNIVKLKRRSHHFSEEDAILITYGDQLQGSDPALSYLNDFLTADLRGGINGVHILPFYPFSSDEGFSIIDYKAVNPKIGTWESAQSIARNYRLMADLVLNHCSVKHAWFQQFLQQERQYAQYFITESPNTDLTQVFRPRTSPLLHPFKTKNGEQHVWTTFSADQVDLNYSNPQVLLEMIDVLLFYVTNGVSIIRLDAVAYLWKEVGSTCIHHPKTHLVVQLLRSLLQQVAAHTVLITETNVPHADNISYFGDGQNEAHMVYNFSLPPLTLDALIRGDARHLTQWASTLKTPSSQCTFFNFLASHDGIGLLPAYTFLSKEEIDNLITTTTNRGGKVSYKQTAEGAIPYEINANYLSAVTDASDSISDRCRTFLTAQTIMCALAGVPAPYIQSVLGSENWYEGIAAGAENRSINRQKYRYGIVREELLDPLTLRNQVFNQYRTLLHVRKSHAAFHPNAKQVIHDLDPRVFAVQRTAEDGESIFCLHNTSKDTVTVSTAHTYLQSMPKLFNLLEDIEVEHQADNSIKIAPHQSLWIDKFELDFHNF